MKIKPYYEAFQSPLGTLYIIFSGKDLSGISFKKPTAIRLKSIPDSFKKQLRDYFSGRLRQFNQSITFRGGTEFEKQVWLTLKNVSYGETKTYKWLAERMGNPKSSKAVGHALSKNPIPIVLPCHRIIESDGHIGGYSSGVSIKRRLLDMEYYFCIESKKG